MMAPKKLFAAALASLPLLAFGQTPAAEPAKPAEPAPAAAPAPAPAPAPAVQIYGTFNVNAQYYQAKDATAGNASDIVGRGAVSIDSSNIGVRGTLDLGSTGLKATYQCETGASVDGIAGATLCNRNSRLGMTFGLGTLWYGNWDTPFKASAYGTKAEDPFGNTDVFGFQGIMGSPGANYRSGGFVSAAAVAAPANTFSIGGFDIRAQNSIGFHSAKFSGVSFKLQYSTDEFATANGKIEPSLYSAVVNYDNGPLSVFATYERHDDAYGLAWILSSSGFGAAGNAASGQSTDWAWRVGAGYELPLGFGPLTVSAAVEQLFFEQESAPAGVDNGDRLAWQIGAKQRIGNHEFRARYSTAEELNCSNADGSTCDAPDTGAQMVAVGYAYFWTKSFQTYLSAANIMNDDSSRYTVTIGGPNVATSTPAGADPLVVGLGARLAF
jgi:predicted porin